jgi:alkylation response protein AidB-like acyl-CoA dehydrogenase
VNDLAERLSVALPKVREGADATDRDAKFPVASMQALAEQGLLGLTLPEEVGGLGGSPSDLVTAVRAVAGACGSTSMVYLMHLASAAVLGAAPPSEGAEELLAAMADGSVLGTLAFSEKGSRSHFWAPVSRAERRGGRVRVRADKSWVTSASAADVYVVSTLAPESSAPTESDLYVLERIADGVSVAGGFDGLGLRGNDSAPVTLDVELAESARLGDEGAGFALMMQVVLPTFSLGNSAVSLGLADAALQAAIDHASRSRFEHLDSSLADLPTIRAYLAKSHADLAAHSALLAGTAAALADPDDSTTLAVLTTKAACNEAAVRITETALRVCGGAGFSRQVGIDRPYRDARAGFVMAPTSDALFDFAGRALCGMELF